MSDEPFAFLLADDFMVTNGSGLTADLARAFEATGKSQLSVMKVEVEEMSKYGVGQWPSLRPDREAEVRKHAGRPRQHWQVRPDA